jgi:hypothetical protein
VLVDLQAAFVSGNQLDLSVGEAFGRQVGEHLMAEQVRVNRLLVIALHNLLDSARPWVGGRLGASESLGRV